MYTIISKTRRGNKKAFSLVILFLLLVSFLLLPVAYQGFATLTISASRLVNGFFVIDDSPPLSSSANQSEDTIYIGNPVVLSAYWEDPGGLGYAWLATNETGVWENKSGIYGSPVEMSGTSGWSNFTWMNPSSSGAVGWRIYANNTAGLVNSTEDALFEVLAPPSPPPPEEPGGGPSHAALPFESNFTVDSDFIKVILKQGETQTISVTILNNGDTRLDIDMNLQHLEGFILLSEENFTLEPGQAKMVTLDFSASEDERPDVYAGRMIIKGDGIEKVVRIIIEVKERKPLFDIYSSLENTPFELMPGDEFTAEILLYNFGDLKPVDVELFYSLRDFDGNDIVQNHETLAVEEQRLVKRKIFIPRDLEPGYYLLYSRVDYSNQTASSSALIEVVEFEERFEIPWTILIFVALAVTVAVIIFLLRKYFRKEGGHVRPELIPLLRGH